MNRLQNPIIVTAFLIILLACCGVSGHESEEAVQKPYVDLDGDGFNDNADDTDNDGIPDHFEKGLMVPRAAAATATAPRVDIFAALKQTSQVLTMDMAVSPLEHFALRQFACRAQSKCRSNFESEFTAGLGITAGSSGSHCVGGVCF